MAKLTKESINKLLSQRFENQNIEKLSQLPKPNELLDLEKSVERIIKAIKNKEKIFLVGDYDVDGIMSTSTMIRFFKDINYPLEWTIPNRFKDGYGIKKSVIKDIETDVIITVDNGITGYEAADYCKEKNIDLIITDHHKIINGVKPNAYTIVDPHQDECSFPFKDICGAQVAWYLLAELNNKLYEHKLINKKIDMKKYLDLVALAIVADIMPLIEINRIMLKTGLNEISKENIPFTRGLMMMLNKKTLESEDIAFQIAPMINSSGRLKDARIAIEAITSDNFNDTWNKIEELRDLNEQRKKIQDQTFEEAEKQVKNQQYCINVKGENWHEGVIGIVASKIAEKYQLPTFVFSKTVKNGKTFYKGSGRSVGTIDIFQALSNVKETIEQFGGHPAAAGLSIKEEQWENYDKAIKEELSKTPEKEFQKETNVLGEIDIFDIDFELMEILEKFKPYGEKNPAPQFKISKILALDIKVLKGKHHKFNFKKTRKDGQFKTIEGIIFNSPKNYQIGVMDIVFDISKNTFRGKTKLNLMIKEIKD